MGGARLLVSGTATALEPRAHDDSYPTWRKWQILGVMFIIQISINLNASLYANGVVRLDSHRALVRMLTRGRRDWRRNLAFRNKRRGCPN